jgi:hypothetical protein
MPMLHKKIAVCNAGVEMANIGSATAEYQSRVFCLLYGRIEQSHAALGHSFSRLDGRRFTRHLQVGAV